MNYLRSPKLRHALLLCMVVAVGALLRLTGISWDDNTHLHPDERFLTMVTTNTDFPKHPLGYFDTQTSPLNPHNRGFSFYVYGTYPVHITKVISTLIRQNTYNGITLTGRALSAIADIITIILVFFIAARVAKSELAGLLASFLYMIAVIPIQLSHFFTVDPFATLFITIVLWHLVRGKFGVTLGAAAGLAVAAKVSTILIVPTIAAAILFAWPKRQKHAGRLRLIWSTSVIGTVIGFAAAVRIAYPYLFDGWQFNQKVLGNWKQLASFDGPTTSFPPGIQWIGVPFWQPALDLFVWGLGLPLGILTVSALLWTVLRLRRQWQIAVIILLLWIVSVLGYQSFQFAKAMRYVWPIYPALAVLTGIFLWRMTDYLLQRSRYGMVAVPALFLLLVFWPLSYISVYTKPNTRVYATNWIYTHIPAGSVIAWEHWDDPLPFPYNDQSPSRYTQIQLPSFDPDDAEKTGKISGVLRAADYIVLSSNRGYGAVGRASTRFPIMHEFYRKLFSGALGYTLVAQISSRPTIPLPVSLCISIPGFNYGYQARAVGTCESNGLSIIDDYADETFTVYDHPKVLIFKKTGISDL